MRNYIKFLLIAFVCGLFAYAGAAISSKGILLSDVILTSAFGNVEFYPQYFTEVLYWYVPILFFQFFYGTYIYRHFCTASVYFFSRKCNRTKWFLLETGRLYIFAFLYVVIFVIAEILCCVVFSSVYIDVGFVYVLLYYIVIYSLFLLASSLAVNLASILVTSNFGVLLVQTVILFSAGLYLLLGESFITDDSLISKYAWMIKINPFSHLIINLHSSRIEELNSIINIKNIDFDINISCGLFILINLVLVIAGCMIVKHHNFILSNQETEGV